MSDPVEVRDVRIREAVPPLVPTPEAEQDFHSDSAPAPPRSAEDELLAWLLRRRSAKRRATAGVRLAQVGVLVVFLVTWELLVATGAVRELFISRPSAVFRFLIDQRASILENAGATLSAVGIGFAVGSLGGVAIGIVLGWFRMLDRVFDPWVSVLASIPRIALAPLFILWFGITQTSKVALAVSVVLFLVLLPTRSGVRAIDQDLVTITRALGGSKRTIFRSVVLPGAVPAIFAGLRLGVIAAVLGVVASEMVAARTGLGRIIVFYAQNLQPAGVFGVLAVLAVVTALLNGLVAWWERRLLRWRPEGR